jgi:drug/metabolite transporter (DMT)-like permease
VKSPKIQEGAQSNGVVWVALGASLWGFDAVLRQPLTDTLASSTIVFYEHLVLAAALLPAAVLQRRRWRAFRLTQWIAVLWISWGGSALGTLCYTQAIKLGNPTAVVFLQKLQPLIAVLLARLWLRETQPLRGRFWVSLGVAMGAALLISVGGGSDWTLQGDPFRASSFWALAAAAIWGSCTVAGRYLLPGVSPLLLTSLRILLALPLLSVLVLAGSPSSPSVSLPTVEAGDILSLLLLALVPGFLGLFVYYRGLHRTPASLATLAELCFPAAAAVLNWVFLGTEVTPVQLIGVGLLWAAVLWSQRVRDSAVGIT